MTSLRWGMATDVGRVRTNNEDALLIEPPLFAVADGMGGPAAGEVASAIAVSTLKAAFATNHSRDTLADAVRHANEAIYDRAQSDPALRGMGTTLTAVALVPEEGDEVLAVVNVGDSRAYRMRDGELEQLTDDHSLVEEMVRIGQLAPHEASTHPQRHILTRALGVQPDVEVDCFAITPFAGDRYLLASDGLMNEVDDRDIATVLRRHPDPDEAARRLVEQAKVNGGSDNVTVVVVDVVDDDDRSLKASQQVAAAPSPARPTLREDGPPPADVGGAPSSPPAPDTPAARPVESRPAGRRRLTLKTAVFVVALLAVVGGALAAVGFYARGGYYVGLDAGRVTIFQGRPGGLLWFKPTVKQHTDLAAADVPAPYQADVRDGKEEPSLEAARTYVDNLRQAAAPPSTTTTTTAPPPTPTSAP